MVYILYVVEGKGKKPWAEGSMREMAYWSKQLHKFGFSLHSIILKK